MIFLYSSIYSENKEGVEGSFNMKLRKVFFLVIMLCMLFSNSVLAATVPDKEIRNKGEENKQNIQTIKVDELETTYNKNDTVRVVVEMNTEPTVQYAQAQAKQVKELPKSTKEKLKSEKLAEQKKVKEKVKARKVKFKELENFTTIFNGFSGEMKYGDIEKIEELPEVAKVHIATAYERPEEEADMIYSKELVQAQDAWRDYGFKGEGMIVGVIDTGIDPNHKDMVLSDETEEELSKEEIAQFKKENGLKGKFYSEKVPYGYNYMDENDIIQDIAEGASMHGMHVAGTVGANGDEDNNGIKGVAPEAQLLALKVFGNDPTVSTTWGDIYIKAIDDAIVLGADVLNMSLGSPAGFVAADAPEQQAVERAVENGIMMSISAGNSAHFGNGFANPSSSNPDIGVSGSPGVAYDSLQVASIENSFIDIDALSYQYDGQMEQAGFLSAGSVHPNSVTEKTFKIVYAGLGKPEELAAVDVKDNYALIQRGEIGFVDKAINAQQAGAAGVIIYNNTDGFVSMATDASIKIPQLFLLKTDGDKLAAALQSGETISITFDGKKITSANPEAGKMSSFSSWGLTNNLDFKPEITAPGGQIYSTLENNQYGMKSGTSMAAPHVSGGSALVLERVDNEFDVSGFDRVNIAKNLLMNTAKPVTDIGTVNSAFDWEVPYSPRRQGAGLMQLHAALQSPVIVTEKKTKEGKVALKEVGNTFTFTLEAKNYSDKKVKYDVAANIQTDFAAYGELGYTANLLEAQKILDAKIKVNDKNETTISIPANKSKKIKVSVDLTNAKVIDPSQTGSWETPVAIDRVFENGYFVEGYVTLTDPQETNATLTVPYVGFKGDWNKAPILDGMKYDETSFYGMAGAVTKEGEDFLYLGYDPITSKFTKEGIAISPNNDGVQEEIIPVLSFLRNAKKVQFSIVDSKGKTVRTLRTQEEIRKNYYDGGKGTKYVLDSNWAWDGKVNGKLVEGQYFYRVSATLDYKGAKPQIVDIPVIVDTVSPTVEVDLAEDNKVLEIAASDDENGSGISYLDILVDGKSVVTTPVSGETTEFTLPNEVKPGTSVTVVAYDYAGNKEEASVVAEEEKKDTTIPVISLATPEALEVYGEKEVVFSGTIKDESDLKEFTIGGQKVDTVYNEEKEEYTFNTVIPYENGVHSVEIKAIDSADNTAVFKRSFIVDAEAPVISFKGLSGNRIVNSNGKNPTVHVTVKDNFDDIQLALNGSELYYQTFKEPYAMRSLEKTIKKVELDLENGLNEFEFTATDLAGHKTTKTVYFYKMTKQENRKDIKVPEDK